MAVTIACEFGPRLGFAFTNEPVPEQSDDAAEDDEDYYFTIDDQLLYLSFYRDSGPLNAACLYRFCLHVHTLLEDPKLKQRRIVLYSADEPDKKANAVLLLALYAMVVMRWSPADVLHPLSSLQLQPFRDAGYARADYHLSHQSILYGIHRAIQSHLLDLSTFDLNYYETYEKVENGDWNWLTPGFVAFASPVEPSFINSLNGTNEGKVVEGARPRLSKAFRNVLDEFDKAGVKVVVRLNKQLYDKSHFLDRGIDHVEMYFDDGTNPTLEMSREFIHLSDRIISAGGSVAVHCKAGLGRTGTLIGAYLIYKHGFTASEAIGFMRLMRPGSCVGPQQHFLYENQMTWIKWSAVDAYKSTIPPQIYPSVSASKLARSTTPLGGGGGGGGGTGTITPPHETALAITRSRNTTPIASTSSLTNLPPTTTTTTNDQSTMDVPKTPSRKIIVPGQPRKTPGKSKHSVAEPETRPVEIAPLVLVSPQKELVLEREREEVEMEVDMNEEMEEEEKMDAEMEPISLVARTPSAAPTSSTSRSATTLVAPTSSRPTRIARSAKSRSTTNKSLSSLDHTTTASLAAAAAAAAGGGVVAGAVMKKEKDILASPTKGGKGIVNMGKELRRESGRKSLGTLFEGIGRELVDGEVANEEEIDPLQLISSAGKSTRYALRPALPLPPAPSSPSKLPLRSVSRKRSANSPAKPLEPEIPSAPKIVTRSGSSSSGSFLEGGIKRTDSDISLGSSMGRNGELGRSVRRRRSSLGSVDFVAVKRD